MLKTLPTTILILSTALLGMACAHTASDLKTASQSDSQYDFKNAKTYQWEGAVGALNDPDGTWNPSSLDSVSELHFLINRELSKKNFSQVTENPDVVVMMAVVLDMDNQEMLASHKKDIETLVTLPKGALVVMLVDAKTNQVVWIGEAESGIKNIQDISIVKKRLDAAVTGMFKKFPR